MARQLLPLTWQLHEPHRLDQGALAEQYQRRPSFQVVPLERVLGIIQLNQIAEQLLQPLIGSKPSLLPQLPVKLLHAQEIHSWWHLSPALRDSNESLQVAAVSHHE